MLAAHLGISKTKENYFEPTFDPPVLLLLSGNNHIMLRNAGHMKRHLIKSLLNDINASALSMRRLSCAHCKQFREQIFFMLFLSNCFLWAFDKSVFA